ncbi:hypothetical protein GCM10025789_10880 [Tessaracoccus lubricantis]|uniref:Uncharacterized protein n=1 Tax=Tessaracoccus lubricantis TaxID=545543 RepID=A0ABP9F669_9ACTN
MIAADMWRALDGVESSVRVEALKLLVLKLPDGERAAVERPAELV